MNLSQYASKMSNNGSSEKCLICYCLFRQTLLKRYNILLSFILADFTKMLQYPTVVYFGRLY